MAKKKLNKRTQKKLYKALASLVLILGFYAYRALNPEQKTPIINTVLNVNQIKCVDGDTFWYADEKIRLLAIDAPESTTRVDPWGPEAASFTCDTLKAASNIRLEVDAGNEVDKYDRKLYWVFLDDKLLQTLLIEEGLAQIKYVDKKTVNQTYYLELQQAQTIAENKKKGLWSTP